MGIHKPINLNDIVRYINKTEKRPQQKYHLHNKKGRVIYIIADIGTTTIYCTEFDGLPGIWFCSRTSLKIITVAAA